MGWRKRRQQKWIKDKDKGIWTKETENRKEVQRGTQEGRDEREGRSKSSILERGRIK
jgi:hypothetical protein